MAQQVRGGPAHPYGSRMQGELGAGAGGWQRCSTCSLSPGITITRGGCSRCLLGSSGGREFGCCCSGRAPYGAALQTEGRCQRLRQPRVPHLGIAFYFFLPAAFAPAFALVCPGKPHPRDHGTPTVPLEGCKARAWARRMSRGFLARGDLGEILFMRPSLSWVIHVNLVCACTGQGPSDPRGVKAEWDKGCRLQPLPAPASLSLPPSLPAACKFGIPSGAGYSHPAGSTPEPAEGLG